MGIRDAELDRLIKYAQGLNCRVSIRPDFRGNQSAGSCSTDGREIEIFYVKHMSKIDLILTLMHEIGHLQYNIHNYNRVPDRKLDEALEDETDKKRFRKIIYEYEKASAGWWDVIYKETEMSFPFYWLERQRDFDVWQYKVYYERGVWPLRDERMSKREELRRKYVSKTPRRKR